MLGSSRNVSDPGRIVHPIRCRGCDLIQGIFRNDMRNPLNFLYAETGLKLDIGDNNSALVVTISKLIACQRVRSGMRTEGRMI